MMTADTQVTHNHLALGYSKRYKKNKKDIPQCLNILAKQPSIGPKRS